MDWEEQKQAGKTPAHAAVIANNALVLLGSKKSTISYKGSTELVLLTNGKVRFPFTCEVVLRSELFFLVGCS
jgi:hypothetical protein